jgi:hypothetical protein
VALAPSPAGSVVEPVLDHVAGLIRIVRYVAYRLDRRKRDREALQASDAEEHAILWGSQMTMIARSHVCEVFVLGYTTVKVVGMGALYGLE